MGLSNKAVTQRFASRLMVIANCERPKKADRDYLAYVSWYLPEHGLVAAIELAERATQTPTPTKSGKCADSYQDKQFAQDAMLNRAFELLANGLSDTDISKTYCTQMMADDLQQLKRMLEDSETSGKPTLPFADPYKIHLVEYLKTVKTPITSESGVRNALSRYNKTHD